MKKNGYHVWITHRRTQEMISLFLRGGNPIRLGLYAHYSMKESYQDAFYFYQLQDIMVEKDYFWFIDKYRGNIAKTKKTVEHMWMSLIVVLGFKRMQKQCC